MHVHIHFIVYKHMNVKTLLFYHFRYDISCFEFHFYRGISIFTLSLSIFILSYCILIVFSILTVWNHFYFRSLSDRLSDLSKVSMMICSWYFLFIDFHTEKDFLKRENFCYNIFLDTNWKLWLLPVFYI